MGGNLLGTHVDGRAHGLRRFAFGCVLGLREAKVDQDDLGLLLVPALALHHDVNVGGLDVLVDVRRLAEAGQAFEGLHEEVEQPAL